MGMMDMAPMPQQQPVSPQGMMGGKSQSPDVSHGKFNGIVRFDDTPVEVKDGVAQVSGKPYLVSDSGAMIMSVDGQLLGHVENGVAVPVDEQYTAKMRDAGYVN